MVLAYVGVSAFFAFAGANLEASPVNLDDPETVRGLLTVGMGFGFVLPLILGMLIVNLEFQNNTILYSLIGSSSRSGLYTAKLITGACSAGLFSAVAALLTSGAVGAIIAGSDYSHDVFTGETLKTLGLVVLVGALLGIAGGAIGALITKPLIAIVIVILWTQIIEPIIRVIAPSGAQSYLPSSLIDASLGGGFLAEIFASESVPQPTALATLVGTTAVLALLGGLRFTRRDV